MPVISADLLMAWILSSRRVVAGGGRLAGGRPSGGNRLIDPVEIGGHPLRGDRGEKRRGGPAREASPQSRMGSAGRSSPGSVTTCRFQSSPTEEKAMSSSSRRVWVSPVATT